LKRLSLVKSRPNDEQDQELGTAENCVPVFHKYTSFSSHPSFALCVPIALYAGQQEGNVSTEQELRQKLRKIAALFEGATTVGEQDAAAAAIERVRAALKATEQKEKSIETNFRLPDRWSRRLFTALCRRHGLTPYRYPRQRYSTVVLRAPASFINNVLWPEFLEIKSALDEYLDEATERIIREEVFRVSEEAEERVS
jgi:hypothetical protein